MQQRNTSHTTALCLMVIVQTYFSIADDIAFIDSEYSVVCLKTLVPCAPRQDNTASLPSRIGTSDSVLNTSPLMTSSFSCLL